MARGTPRLIDQLLMGWLDFDYDLLTRTAAAVFFEIGAKAKWQRIRWQHRKAGFRTRSCSNKKLDVDPIQTNRIKSSAHGPSMNAVGASAAGPDRTKALGHRVIDCQCI